jgi:hypothetical protein
MALVFNPKTLEWESRDAGRETTPVLSDDIESATSDRLKELMSQTWPTHETDGDAFCWCPGCRAKRELKHRRNMVRAGEESPFKIRFGRREVR